MDPKSPVETDLLIVGAGPAGASLACFLARYGLKGIVISSAPGTARTPRAHINNPAAMECMRDIGLWDECRKLGHGGVFLRHFRWCETMAGEEYARVYSFGEGVRQGDVAATSPCWYLDLPQNLLEPVLVKFATTNGFKVRFDTQLIGFEEKGGGKVLCDVRDRVSGATYQISTKYLFGADGARSLVAQKLDLPMTEHPGGGMAFNVLVRADLSHLMRFREGNLNWCVRLERDYPFTCVGRMVKPWYEWIFVFFPKGPGVAAPERSEKEWKEVVEDYIGDPKVQVEVLDVSKWLVNETSANVISKGNVFCLGDAIHRHPPTLGLGSNTCIQDAFNLSWKIHLVLKGLASPSLLSTYNTERQPVAAQLVKESNDILRKHAEVWQALGAKGPGSSEEERMQGIRELRQNTPGGRQRRKLLKERIDYMQHETNTMGIQMGQLYTSTAIDASSEPRPFAPGPREASEPALYYDPSTYPGRRLPHVWLNTPVPGPLVSTLDIAGKGRFALFTGIGGELWKEAAQAVGEELGVEIKAVAIGIGAEWEDPYFEWMGVRGVEDDGCVLVRPDLFVAWRAESGGEELQRLGMVLRGILGVKDSASG